MSISRRRFLVNGAAAFVPCAAPRLLSSQQDSETFAHELWYDTPASRWFEALPLGNGHLGAMVFGGIETERIALSESTAWSGAAESDTVNAEACAHLDEIRHLLFTGRYVEARALCERYLLARPLNFGTNLPLPELRISFGTQETISSCRRSLDLESAVARVEYRWADTRIVREVFASHSDRVLVMHIRGDGPGRLNCSVAFGEALIPVSTSAISSNTLVLRGDAFETMHSSGKDGVHLEIHAQVLTRDGSVRATPNTLQISGAREATVLVAIATNFDGRDQAYACTQVLKQAASKEVGLLRRRHVEDHQALYTRVSLDLGKTGTAQRAKPTNLRREMMAKGADDPELLALFFQYGRYLTIAGSRADSALPLALQGIWNDGLASSMEWTDDFHLDINTEQNYWAAEVTNLGECQLPLFRWIEVLRESGRRTARGCTAHLGG